MINVNDDEMRKEFEELISTGELLQDLFTKSVSYFQRLKMVSDCFDGNEYKNAMVQLAYEAFTKGWKTSRDTQKPICLPAKYIPESDNETSYYNTAVDECKEAIQQAGYEVEE